MLRPDHREEGAQKKLSKVMLVEVVLKEKIIAALGLYLEIDVFKSFSIICRYNEGRTL